MLQFAGYLSPKTNQFQSLRHHHGAVDLRHARYQMSPLEHGFIKGGECLVFAGQVFHPADRLNVFPITLPPLRQRREDIPALVNHLVEKKSKDLKTYPPPAVSLEEVERLKTYDWPGNIRELENLVERELIRMRGKGRVGRLTFEHLEVQERSKASSLEPEREGDLLTLDEAMSRQIRQALQRCNGKVSGPGGAAQLLEINPNTLRSRMRKLGLL